MKTIQETIADPSKDWNKRADAVSYRISNQD